MGKVIVYTRRTDGGVALCVPAAECLAWMTCGGYWADQPRGFLNTQIERQIADGRHPDAARRFVHAVQFGGLSSQEALAVIRDRDCAHLGTGCELWDRADLAKEDRWFRDAWVRSHNGGPIRVDLERARSVQWRHLRVAADHETHRRVNDVACMRGPVELDWAALKERICAARALEALRGIWPTM